MSLDKQEGIPFPLVTKIDGRTWYCYGLNFTTTDGEFLTYIYALSDEHAQMICAELKETARISGQIIGFTSA